MALLTDFAIACGVSRLVAWTIFFAAYAGAASTSRRPALHLVISRCINQYKAAGTFLIGLKFTAAAMQQRSIGRYYRAVDSLKHTVCPISAFHAELPCRSSFQQSTANEKAKA
jgi:hypothetical protein